MAVLFFDIGAAWVSVVSSFIIILLVCMAICVRRLDMNDIRER